MLSLPSSDEINDCSDVTTPPLATNNARSPTMKFAPLPAVTVSLPRPGKIQSWPLPAVIVSLSWKSGRSRIEVMTDPLTAMSAESPIKTSFPFRPLIVSAPPIPMIRLSELLPVIPSAAELPVISSMPAMVPTWFKPVLKLTVIEDDQAEKSMKSRAPAPASVNPVKPLPGAITKVSSPEPVVTPSTDSKSTNGVEPRIVIPVLRAFTLTRSEAV